MSTRARTWLSEDEGAVAAFAAFSFLVIIAFLALIIDVGYSYAVRREVQAAADAAALAGCDQLIETVNAASAASEARTYAMSYQTGLADQLDPSDVTVQVDPGALSGGGVTPSVTVRIAYAAPLFFGSMFGRDEAAMTAVSKAEVQKVSGARYVAPYGVPITGRISSVRYQMYNSAGAQVGSGVLAPTDATNVTWRTSITAPAVSGGYDIKVYYANELGAEETLWDTRRAAETTTSRLLVRGPDIPCSSSFSSPLFAELEAQGRPNYLVNVFVETTAGVRPAPLDPAVDGSFDYRLLVTYPAKYSGFVVAYAHARSPEHPVRSAVLASTTLDPGGSTEYTVTFNPFDPREWASARAGVGARRFYLRNDGGGETAGDYVALNCNSVSHSACAAQPFPASSLVGNTDLWQMWGYSGPLHVDDVVQRLNPPGSRVLRQFNQIGPRGRYANLPIVMRTPAGGFRVVGFVNATILADYAPAQVTSLAYMGDYVATPHEFEPGLPTNGRNAVFAARLVSP